MTTCTVIVNDALRYLNMNNGILPVDPRNQNTAFNCLVDLLKMLRGDSIVLSRQYPAAISADLKEPEWATAGLKEMLAKTAAPYLQAKIPATLGSDGERVLRTRGTPPIECSMPSTLPTGSGNAGYFANTFYTGDSGVVYEITAHRNQGESGTFYADFDYDAVQRGTSVSSVTWTSEGAASVGISGQAIATNLASALLTFSSAGSAIVRARATYANTQIKDFLFNVEVV